ncbi:MAG: hypothetical protein ACLPVO_12940 [Desulfomonilaceae bacterium]
MTDGASFLEWLLGNTEDWSVERFLGFMKWAFEHSDHTSGAALGLKGYHENIENFKAVYVFETEDHLVQATACFNDGSMVVETGAATKWDLKISFKDVLALWRFIFSGGNDIVDSMLANDVQVYGNLNYLYKFGFMAKDLVFQRLGLKRIFV